MYATNLSQEPTQLEFVHHLEDFVLDFDFLFDLHQSMN